MQKDLQEAPAHFNERYGPLLDKLGIKEKQLKSGDAAAWKTLRAKVRKWAAEIYQPGEASSLQWATGTRSMTLIGMDRIAKTQLTPVPALVHPKELVNWNVVPLTGELCNGILDNAVNTRSISGVYFSKIQLAYEYANRNYYIFNQEDELNYIVNFIPGAFPLLRLKIAVLRLIHSGANTLKQAEDTIRNVIIPTMKVHSPSEAQLEEVEKILELFQTEKPLNLSKREHSFIEDSFPIIFG